MMRLFSFIVISLPLMNQYLLLLVACSDRIIYNQFTLMHTKHQLGNTKHQLGNTNQHYCFCPLANPKHAVLDTIWSLSDSV